MKSGFIFIIVLDWVMRRTVEEERNGIRWNFSTALEDLIFADDIALISSTWSHMQRKTSRLERNAVYVGLKMSVKKTEVMRINARRQDSIKISGSEIEDTDEFTYLGSTMTKDGGAEADIRKRLSKARSSFNILGKVLKSESYSGKTKLRLFKSNVIPVLLYGAELWRVTGTDDLRLDRFHRVCLKKIMKIRWPMKSSNEELYRLTSTKPVSETIRERRWRYIGHILRREPSSHVRVALTWKPEGRRKKGRPKETWRRMVEREMKTRYGWNGWRETHQVAHYREMWRQTCRASISTRGETSDGWMDGNLTHSKSEKSHMYIIQIFEKIICEMLSAHSRTK